MKIEGSQLRIMSENLLTTGLVSLTTSLIKTGYNIKDMTSYNRNEHFSFAGTFVIDATNKSLTINGINHSLIEGTYKRGELLTHINSYFTPDGITLVWVDGYFKIISDDPFDFVTDSADGILNTLGFTDGIDYENVLEVVSVSSRYHWPYEWIQVDFGYTPNIGFLGIISTSLKEFSFSANANVKVMASEVENFDDPAFEMFIPNITKEGLFQFFTDAEYDFRFWRIEIEDNENSHDVEFGYLYLGEAHTFDERYNDQKATESYTDLSEVTVTENGSKISFERQLMKKYNPIVFRMVTPETRAFMFDIFKRFKTIRPFFISIDPEVEITSEIQELTFFCSFSSSPSSLHYAGKRWDLSFEVEEWL